MCSEPNCTNAFPNHYWGSVGAAGWFMQRSGENWCPDHQPAWVKSWRKKKREGKKS